MRPMTLAAIVRWRPSVRLGREIAGTFLLVASSSLVSPRTNAAFWGSSASWADSLGWIGILGMIVGLATTFSACLRELKAIGWQRDALDVDSPRP